MPIVTGQETVAARMRFSRAPRTRVGTRMSSANQFQASPAKPSGSKTALETMPWSRGGTPVNSVVWEG
jgi:hypothetical protein